MSLFSRRRSRSAATSNPTMTIERNPSMTVQTSPAPAVIHYAGNSPANEETLLRSAISKVDRLALADLQAFTSTRQWFTRADQLAAELLDLRAADEASRIDLIEQLADGEVSADEAATQAQMLARLARSQQRGTEEAGHDVLTAAADLAVVRAVQAAKAGEAAAVMTALRAEGDLLAGNAARLLVPSGALAAFGYTAREAGTWDELMRLLDCWEAVSAAAKATRRAVNRDAVPTMVPGRIHLQASGLPVNDWANVPQKGWELPALTADHVLARAYDERQLRRQAAMERAAEQTREQAEARAHAAQMGGTLRPGAPGSNDRPPLDMR